MNRKNCANKSSSDERPQDIFDNLSIAENRQKSHHDITSSRAHAVPLLTLHPILPRDQLFLPKSRIDRAFLMAGVREKTYVLDKPNHRL
jgi:hypothetical protein